MKLLAIRPGGKAAKSLVIRQAGEGRLARWTQFVTASSFSFAESRNMKSPGKLSIFRFTTWLSALHDDSFPSSRGAPLAARPLAVAGRGDPGAVDLAGSLDCFAALAMTGGGDVRGIEGKPTPTAEVEGAWVQG